MRRLIIFIMVILISTGTVLATGEEISFSNMQEEQEEYILGDVNSNGAIDLHDAIMILQYNVGLIQIDDLQKADVNLDGNIDVKDAILVLKYIVGLIEDFTYLSLPQGSFFVNGGSGGYNLDDKGVPIHDNGSYHPTQIAQYGLDLYADYLNTGSAGYKKKLKPVAEWLLENAEHSSQFSYWTFDFDYSPFNQVAPWNSSLTNAQCALVLLLGHEVFEEQEYLDLSHRAMKYLFIPIENGGGLGRWPDGTSWFEEYPDPGNQSHVLNGHIFVLDVLERFYMITGENKYQYWLEEGLQALKSKMNNYDVHYGSIYDVALEGEKIGMGYHTLHWMMLAWAHMTTGDHDFLELALKWFEMDMQSKGTNINVSGSIDPAGHGSEKLNDGIYWYQYWSTYSPAVISVEHKTESHMNVKGINLFLVGEPDDLSIRVLCKDEHGQMKQLYPGGASTLHPVRKNTTGSHTTTVLPIAFNKLLHTERLEIHIQANNRIVAVREIGVWQDWPDEFQRRLNRYNIKTMSEKQVP